MLHTNAVNRLFCEPEDPLSEFNPYDWGYWDKVSKMTREIETLGYDGAFCLACKWYDREIPGVLLDDENFFPSFEEFISIFNVTPSDAEESLRQQGFVVVREGERFWSLALIVAPDQRPHSRACRWLEHPHGLQCSPDCPTCGQSQIS